MTTRIRIPIVAIAATLLAGVTLADPSEDPPPAEVEAETGAETTAPPADPPPSLDDLLDEARRLAGDDESSVAGVLAGENENPHSLVLT